MKVKNRYTEVEEYLEDRTDYPYVKAVSKIDENNLKQVANDMGIEYISMEKQANMLNKVSEIKNQAESKTLEGDMIASYKDMYYLFVIPLLGLLIFELITYKRKL